MGNKKVMEAKFRGTIEIIGATRAIISLTDEYGEFICGGRLDGHNLYDRGYERLERIAADKGGTLDRYTEVAS